MRHNEVFCILFFLCSQFFFFQIFLEYFDEIVLHEFNPTFPNVVIGGSFPGQLVLWNLTEAMLSEENYNFSVCMVIRSTVNFFFKINCSILLNIFISVDYGTVLYNQLSVKCNYFINPFMTNVAYTWHLV